MLSKTMCAAILALLLTGCASGSGIDVCGAFRPIYPSSRDVLTEGTAEQVLAHNLTGKELCGWRAGR